MILFSQISSKDTVLTNSKVTTIIHLLQCFQTFAYSNIYGVSNRMFYRIRFMLWWAALEMTAHLCDKNSEDLDLQHSCYHKY